MPVHRTRTLHELLHLVGPKFLPQKFDLQRILAGCSSPQEDYVHLEIHSGRSVSNVAPSRDHAGDSCGSSKGKSRRVRRTAAQYAPLHEVRLLARIASILKDLPNIFLATNRHLKPSIRLFQSPKPLPHGLAINEIESRPPTYHGQR